MLSTGELMDTKELGRRIKEIRLAKKMTQSEVVGNYITRNMLSQIESGLATPSMRTLEYIAYALDVSLSTLLLDEDNDAISVLTYAKQALKERRYDDAIYYSTQLPLELEDEAVALLARAHLELAKTYVEKGEYNKAYKAAKAAVEKAQKGIYASRELRATALLLLDELNKA